MVRVTGFEPAVSWSQTRRDTKLRYTQITITVYPILPEKARGNLPLLRKKAAPGAGAAWGSAKLDHLVEGGELGSGELMGDDDHGLVPDRQEQILDPLSRGVVQICQGLVQKQHPGVPEQGPGQAQALFLTAGEIRAALGHRLIQRAAEPGQAHIGQDLPQTLLGDGAVQGQVIAQGVPEQHCLLPDHGHQAVGAADLFEGHSVDLDGAAGGGVVAQQQIHGGGLAAAAGTLQQAFFALFQGKTEVFQDLPLAVVGKIHIPEPDASVQLPEGHCGLLRRGFGQEFLHPAAHGLHRDQLTEDVRQRDQGPGQLVDHADGDEEISRGEIALQHQPSGRYQHEVVGHIGHQRGDQLGDGPQAGVLAELVHGVVVGRSEPGADGVLRGEVFQDLKAREPVRDPGQADFHGGKVGRLGLLEPLFDELGDVQRRGQQGDGQDRHMPVQPEQGRGHQRDLEQDLPEVGLHPESPVPDRLRVGGEFGDVLALGAILVGNIVPGQDAVEDVPAQLGDAADDIPVTQTLEQVIPAHLQADEADQQQGRADRVPQLPRQGKVQHRTLVKLQLHGKVGTEQGADEGRKITAAVGVFVGFHGYLLL